MGTEKINQPAHLEADHLFGQQTAAEVAAAEARPKPRTGSWWADHADPALPREKFITAAHERDREMQADPVWKRPDKMQQIGQL